jgi:hypothetical protein
MAQRKMDGVIEAVRYTPDNKIMFVRAYQRHGAVWSDHVLLKRKDIIELLDHGKHFTTGIRKEYMGGLFETGLEIQYTNGYITTTGQEIQRDLLSGVSLF